MDIGSLDNKAMDTALFCLAAVSGSRCMAHALMVCLGAIPGTVRPLGTTTVPGASANALLILKSAIGCAEGQHQRGCSCHA
jgi:hypothetical protein